MRKRGYRRWQVAVEKVFSAIRFSPLSYGLHRRYSFVARLMEPMLFASPGVGR